MPLRQEFEELRSRRGLTLLESAMLKCRSTNPKIGVTVVGAGDAFINRYWPTLRKHVSNNKIVLSIADTKGLKALAADKVSDLRKSEEPGMNKVADKLQEGYDQLGRFLDMDSDKAVQYFDLSTKEGLHRYQTLHLTDFVFVLVPDHIHLQEARKWLPRATLVFVEKPYASSIREAQEFETEYEQLQSSAATSGGNAIVVPFDHYFAKLMPCIKILEGGALRQIGELLSIDCVLTESRLPEAHRIETLRGGLMADLYPHILAVLSVFTDLESIGHQKRNVQVATVKANPFPTETYARIESRMRDYDGNSVNVKATLGKGIGEGESKHLIVKGSTGQLVINFTPDRVLGEQPLASWIRGSDTPLTAQAVNDGKLCDLYSSGHAEFIEILLQGKYLDEPCGGLVRHQAELIMKELDALRDGVGKMRSLAEYEPKESVEQIASKATLLPIMRN